MSTKKLTNEQIIAGLLQTGTIRDTAKLLDCSEHLIYDRMHDDEFVVEYDFAKTEILRKSVAVFSDHLTEAVDNVVAIMNDQDCKPAVRLQACQIIIKNAMDFTDRLRDADTTNRGQADDVSMYGYIM